MVGEPAAYATGSPEPKAVGPCHAVTNSPITRGLKGQFAGTHRDDRPIGGRTLFRTFETKAGRWLRLVHRVAPTSLALFMGTTAALGAGETANAADFGKWQVKLHADPMNDSSIALVMIQSEADDVTLGLNCRKDTDDVGIIWRRFLGGEEINGEEQKDIIYRVDQGQPIVATWKVMPDRTTVRAFTPEGFVREIRDSSRLVLQVEPYQEMPLTVVFETKGLRDALLATTPECDWFVRDILWDKHLEQAKKDQTKQVAKPVDPIPFEKWTEDAATK